MTENLRSEIRAAFQAGQLRVQSVDQTNGVVSLHPVKDILRHHTEDRPSVITTTDEGSQVWTTCDHSLFIMSGAGIEPVRADDLSNGDQIAVVREGGLTSSPANFSIGDPLPISYDLCVPGPENFVLSNGVVAHNTYSIGGISLDIEKSSKYMDLKRNAEEQFDKLVESKSRTEKYLRGLSQPRFGRGIRSSFGPQVGKGVLSPRNFLAVFLCSKAGMVAWEILHASHLPSLFI